MLADRFPNIISELRKQSVKKAKASGYDITTNDFHIMRRHVPLMIDDNRVWEQLCDVSMLMHYFNFCYI